MSLLDSTPETPATPETPKTPETPAAPETPKTLETPAAPETPKTPEEGKGLLAGKYKTPQDLEKGYNELNKKYREAVEGNKPPEKYETDFSKVEGLEKVKQDDPLLKAMLPTFKALGLPQAKVQTLLQSVYKKMGEMQKEGVLPAPYDQASELKALGEDAPTIIGKLTAYANSRADWDDEKKKIFRSLCMTEKECRVMFDILNLHPAKKVSSGGDDGAPAPTMAEAKQAWLDYEKANKAKLFDPTVQAEARRLKRAYLVLKNPELAKFNK